MTDYKLPELPSDDDLGITDEDRKKYEKDAKPEPVDKELAALLGESPRKAPAPLPTGKPPKAPKAPKPPKVAKSKPAKAATAQKASTVAAEPEGPRSRWRGPVTLVALIALGWTASSWRMLPAPVPANAPDTVFSSARAMANLVEIARRPRPTGSPEHDRVREYLLARLAELGLSPEVQTTTSMLRRDSLVEAATVRNVVARIPGIASTGTVLLTAHYDGRQISTAAADDGVGVVAILEVVRALRAGAELGNDLVVLLTDGEELGLLGARAFVAEHPLMEAVQVVISLEMRGGGGATVMFEAGTENGWIARELAASGARPFANSVSDAVYRTLPNDTDFTPFRDAGRQGLNFAAVGRGSVYHQTFDIPANVSEATLQHHGESALAVVRRLGTSNLTAVDAPDAAFFSVPFLGVVVYDMTLVLPLAGATLLLAVLSLLFVRRRGGGWSGILVGLGVAIIALSLVGGVGLGLVDWLTRFHPEAGSLAAVEFHREGWYVVALAAVAFVVVTSLYGIARRRFRATELAWGALLVPLVATLYLSWRVPAGAMTLQWPTMAAFLGIVLLLPAPGARLASVAWVALIALAAPVLALLLPVSEIVAQVLGLSSAVYLGVLFTLGLLLLLPSLDRLREPNAWWAPLAALIVGASATAMGILSAKPSADRPSPSTLVYAYDHGTGEALWIGDASEDSLDAAAMAWARSKAGGPFGERRSLEHFAYLEGEVPAATAPVFGVAKPVTTVLADTVVDGVRHLRLALRSAVGAERVQLRFPPAGSMRLMALNGREVPAGGRSTIVDHWGRPDSAIVLDLALPADAPVQLDVVEHLLRPEELLGPTAFARPPELAPNARTMSDRVMLRAPFTVLDLRPPDGDSIAAPGEGEVGPGAAENVALRPPP